ncbi:MAG: hypothetical protein JKY56_09095 [Kofleriaceae bacterium]|nr:hypothetical protein [Kofleriaceae bacterium]
MRIWLGVLLVLGCGSSSSNLSMQKQSGKENPSQQNHVRPASKGAQARAGKPVAAAESQPEHNSESGEPEPESELELVIPDIEPAVAQAESASVRALLPPVKPCQKSPSTADEIVSRMECEYRSIGRYQDTGEVRSDRGGIQMTILFETHFVRPDMFRFEFTSHHPYPPLHHLTTTHTMWARGGQVHTTSGRKLSIEMAVAGFTGISRGAAHLVPALLMRFRDEPQWISSNSPARKRRDDYWAGTTCYRVAIVTRLGPMELWIGNSDFLLRKLTMANWEVILDNVDTSSAIPESVFIKP